MKDNISDFAGQQSGKRYTCVDILRSLAALSILMTHWGGWTAPLENSSSLLDMSVLMVQRIFDLTLNAGAGTHHAGVIVFIILSGFSIHLPLAIQPERQKQGNFWKAFAVRRIIRFAPLFWFATLLGVAGLVLVSHYPEFLPDYLFGEKLRLSDLFLNLSFVSGFLLPFRDFNGLGNGVLETLISIMVLYAFYPIVLLILHRCGWFWVFILAGIMHSLSIIFLLIGFTYSMVAFSYFGFFFYWWMGAFVAELFVKQNITRSSNMGHSNKQKWWLPLSPSSAVTARIS